MLASNERDATNRTPPKSHNDSFSVKSIQSSAKKAINSLAYAGGMIPFNLDKLEKPSVASTSSANAPSYHGPMGNNAELMQSKIEHLERERVELTLQLHMKDEKDRDRKFRLEQMEYKLRAAEQEQSRASATALEYRDQLYRLQSEKDDVNLELNRLQKELQNTNRCEAMDVWKKMTATARELKRIEEEYNNVCNDRNALQDEHKHLIEEVEQLRSNLKAKDAELEELRGQSAEQQAQDRKHIAELLQRCDATKHSLQEVCEQRLVTETSYISTISQLEQDKIDLQVKLHERAAIAAPVFPTISLDPTIAGAITDSELARSYEKALVELKEKLFESEKSRRALHNQVQDLKGHVRVFIRCRPFLASDTTEAHGGGGQQSVVTLHQDRSTITLSNPSNASSASSNRANSHLFSFDHTFGGDSTQEDIFQEVSGLVQSALDGFRVCVFSYGQTGSGKVTRRSLHSRSLSLTHCWLFRPTL
jgi:kinesin family protein C1